MSQVDKAIDRLNAALDRLEQAVETRHAGDAGGDDGARTELHAELDTLRAENTDLREVNADAGHRLDKAIERLHGVLGG